MKFTALLIASAVAAASAAETPACDAASLLKAVAGADGIACTKASGYSVATLGFPTEEQLVKLCGNSNCQALFKTFATLAPTECLLTNAKKLHAEMLDPVLAACAKLATTTVVTTTATPTTTATTTKVTTTNATTTTKPSTTTKPTTTEVDATIETPKEGSSSSGSVAETEEVKTPKPTDKTDGAATMAVATGALLAAAAATLF